MIRRLVGLILGLFLLSSVAAGIAAVVAKGRLPSRGEPEDDEIALTAIFEPLTFESVSGAFRGGSLLTWFGGADLDLRGATLHPDGARLTVRTLFGGGRVIVPEDWPVELDVIAILGGIGDARPPDAVDPDAPTLVIDGFAAMGGFGIISTKPELDA
jgi:hypothetical protein